jgi:nucleotide-binding universal stress UspA family protein
LLDSRSPVLLLPENGRLTFPPKRVLLAWDSSLPAANAARASLDLLAAAEGVSLVIVDPLARRRTGSEQSGAKMAQYLARHGANVEVNEVASGGRTVEELLLRCAEDFGADILVMGAYGRSRLRERIFGGATRSMLDMRRLPVLMAH